MRTIFRLGVLSVLAVTQWITSAAGGWSTLGGTLSQNLNTNADCPDIDVINGSPYVTWQEKDTSSPYNTHVWVRGYNGTGWSLSHDLNIVSNQSAAHPCIKSNGGVFPVTVAWEEGDTSFDIYLKSYNGVDWSQLGTTANGSTSNTELPELVVQGGLVYVAYRYNLKKNLEINQYNGSGWESAAVPVSSGGTSMDPYRFEVVNGTPFLAWTELLLVHVQRFNGIGWTTLGSSFNGTIGGLGAGTSQTLHVAYHEMTSNTLVKSVYWNGSEWVDRSSPLNVNTLKNAADEDLVFFQNTPFVTWKEALGPTNIDQIRAAYFNGSTWTFLGDALNRNGNVSASNPAITVNALGTPYVVWVESGGIYVSTFADAVSPTPSPVVTGTPTASPSPTPIPPTATQTRTLSPTFTVTLTPTRTPSPSSTFTPSSTYSPTWTSTVTLTSSGTPTRTSTVSPTPSASDTWTPTVTLTASGTPTRTSTVSPTPSASVTRTPTMTPTASESPTRTVSPTLPPSSTITPTLPPTATPTPAGVFYLDKNKFNPSQESLNLRIGRMEHGPWNLHVRVLTLSGDLVWEQETVFQGPGYVTIPWGGTNRAGETVASGVYFVLLDDGHTRETRKVLAVK